MHTQFYFLFSFYLHINKLMKNNIPIKFGVIVINSISK